MSAPTAVAVAVAAAGVGTGATRPSRIRRQFGIAGASSEAPFLIARRRARRARVEITGRDSGLDPVPAARTSREGIFVRTLIPPGTWEITCLAEGYSPVVLHAVELSAGQHRIDEFTLHPVEQTVQPSEGAESDE